MLKDCSFIFIVIMFSNILISDIYSDWSWFIYLFLRAIILVLIIDYTWLRRGLSVKGAHRKWDYPQFLHNLVLFKLYLARIGAFSFWQNTFSHKFPRDSTRLVLVSHSRIHTRIACTTPQIDIHSPPTKSSCWYHYCCVIKTINQPLHQTKTPLLFTMYSILACLLAYVTGYWYLLLNYIACSYCCIICLCSYSCWFCQSLWSCFCFICCCYFSW